MSPLFKTQICLCLIFRAFFQLKSHFFHVEVYLCHRQRRSLEQHSNVDVSEADSGIYQTTPMSRTGCTDSSLT